MSQIQIVIDSTAYFTKEDIEQYNLVVVPLSVTFSGETKEEGFPGEFDEFYKRLMTSQDFPTTSQPSIDAFAKAYEDALAKGYEVLTIVFSQKLSGTYNSAKAAAMQLGEDKISVVDTATAVGNYKMLVKQAAAMAGKGFSRHQIVEAIDEEKLRTSINLTVDNLEYLKRGGRLSGAHAFIGNLLNVKPIIGLIDGALVPVTKVRGKKKALEYLVNNIPENVKEIIICHILDDEEAAWLKTAIEEKFKNVEIGVDKIGPVIGAHLGPKAIGVCSRW